MCVLVKCWASQHGRVYKHTWGAVIKNKIYMDRRRKVQSGVPLEGPSDPELQIIADTYTPYSLQGLEWS